MAILGALNGYGCNNYEKWICVFYKDAVKCEYTKKTWVHPRDLGIL